MRFSLLASLLLSSFVCACSSSSGGDSGAVDSGPDAGSVAATGTLGGRSFTGQTAVAFVNASSDGTGIDHQTILIFDSAVDCRSMQDAQMHGRYVLLAFAGGAGTTTSTASPKGGLLELDDYTAGGRGTGGVTAGSATLDTEATKSSVLDPSAPPALTHGHVHFDLTAGSDHVSGEADYLLCL